jgi:cytochrome P450
MSTQQQGPAMGTSSKPFLMTRRKYVFPPGLPHNLLFYVFRLFRPGEPIPLFTYLAEKYGEAAHYKLGHQHVVFLNHPDYIREVLVVQNQNFIKERTGRRMKILVGNGLITSEGKFHKTQRALSQPAFHRQRITHYGDTMVEHALRSRESWRDGQMVELSAEMMHLALGIVAKTLFDTDIAQEVAEISGNVNSIMALYDFLVVLPYAEGLQYWPLPGVSRFRKARARLDSVVYRMIEDHRLGAVDRGDLLSMLLAARYEDGSPMADQQLRDEVMTIFLAGYETIANALAWTWYLLSQNPEAERKLHEEIDCVLQGRLPETTDLPNLKYAEMVLAESMRLYPPVWAMGREAIDDVEIGPYYLPEGTTMVLMQYVTHRNPNYFPDPLRFDPERFTPEAKASRPRFSYFPFGAGARQCIGEAFALMEGVLILATIAQRWRFSLVPGHCVEPLPLVTLRPRYGMKMIAHERRG